MNSDTKLPSKPLGSSTRNQWQVQRDSCDLVRNPSLIHAVTLPAQPQNITIDLARTALIIIDMQNDFCHPQGWLGSIGVDTQLACSPIVPLQKLLPKLRRANVPILWVNWGNRPDKINLSPSLLHVYSNDGVSTGLGDALATVPLSQLKSNKVLEKDSWGAAVVSPLDQHSNDVSIDKFRMSGFYDTCLDSALRNLDVKTILFAGVNADQCVLATLMDANFLGYDCVFLEDCCATTSPDFCRQATVYNVRQCFGFTADSRDLCDQIN